MSRCSQSCHHRESNPEYALRTSTCYSLHYGGIFFSVCNRHFLSVTKENIWCPWRDSNPQWPFGSLSVRSGVFYPVELHGQLMNACTENVVVQSFAGISFMAEKEGIEPPALLQAPLSRRLDNQFCHFLHLVVGVVRFELTTCTLSECRANQLRHTPIELLVLKYFSDVGYYIKMAPLRGTEESSAAISCSPGLAVHIPIAHALSAFANYNPVCGIDEIFTRVSSTQDFLTAR